VAKALSPKIIVVENVPQFLTRKVRDPKDQKPITAADYLIRELRHSYVAFPIVAELGDYGVPQRRKRAFITFVAKDVRGLCLLKRTERAPFPRPSHATDYGDPGHVTFAEALGDFNLPVLDAASAETATSKGHSGMHAVPVWDKRVYEMVGAIPPNSGRSAWQNEDCLVCGEERIANHRATCPSCGSTLPRPVVKAKNGRYRLIKGFHSSYRRMRPNEPASTITTATGHVGSDTTIHPSQNRLLSPLECALLQTFPRTFAWGQALEKWGSTNVRDMIGEAVPPLFTAKHGKILVDLLRAKEWAFPAILAVDERCERARQKLDFKDGWHETRRPAAKKEASASAR
jgi:DNA (cytosine-5)-methyltransferase 1